MCFRARSAGISLVRSRTPARTVHDGWRNPSPELRASVVFFYEPSVKTHCETFMVITEFVPSLLMNG